MNPERSFFAAFAIAGSVAIGVAVWALTIAKQKNALAAELTASKAELASSQAASEGQLEKLREESETTVATLHADHQKELLAIAAAHEKELDALRERQTTRVAEAYQQLNRIAGESEGVVKYIASLENRLREGKGASRKELEKLAGIASALGALQQQYQQPLAEFTQLRDYFTERASETGSVDRPDMRFAGLKRIFSSQFRDHERSYQQDVGKRIAYKETERDFKVAYGKAQEKMKKLGSSLTDQAKEIYTLIDTMKQEETAQLDELESFFRTSKRTLNIHREMLDFDPSDSPPPAPTTTP